MSKVTFAVEKIEDEDTGQTLDAVVKTAADGTKDTWCTILDLDKLFGACVKKWEGNWNLDKVIAAIEDSDVR